ncbi:MAG: ribbon-helix-helix protein, CopG family [Candidatus Helarchaeota archaeon]|nr:ribbon-helix-helix protein, CopG family [Candidatus Helarchaeota archaeon]
MLAKLSIKIPKEYLEQIDKLVESGLYVSRTEAIRNAVYDIIWDEI